MDGWQSVAATTNWDLKFLLIITIVTLSVCLWTHHIVTPRTSKVGHYDGFGKSMSLYRCGTACMAVSDHCIAAAVFSGVYYHCIGALGGPIRGVIAAACSIFWRF
jgi:hypothetical protein